MPESDTQKRLRDLEADVKAIKWVGGIMALIVSGGLLAGLVWNYVSLHREAAAHTEAIGTLKESVKELREDVKKLQVYRMALHFRTGTVARVEGRRVTVRLGKSGPEFTYALLPDGQVIVRGKPGRLSDLKPGLYVEVAVVSEDEAKKTGEATVIEVKDPDRPD